MLCGIQRAAPVGAPGHTRGVMRANTRLVIALSAHFHRCTSQAHARGHTQAAPVSDLGG